MGLRLRFVPTVLATVQEREKHRHSRMVPQILIDHIPGILLYPKRKTTTKKQL